LYDFLVEDVPGLYGKLIGSLGLMKLPIEPAPPIYVESIP